MRCDYGVLKQLGLSAAAVEEFHLRDALLLRGLFAPTPTLGADVDGVVCAVVEANLAVFHAHGRLAFLVDITTGL